MTASQKVQEVRDAIAGLKAQRKEALEAATAAVATATKDGETIVLDADRVKEGREKLQAASDLREQIELQEKALAEIEWGSEPAAQAIGPEVLAELRKAGFSVVEGPVGKGLSQLFVESEPFQAMMKAGAYKTDAPFKPSKEAWRNWFRKDVYTDLPSGTPGSFGTIIRDPFVEATRRRVRVRDLFPARPISGTTVEYFRVTGYTNNASTVAERNEGNTGFQTKPKTDLAFEGRTTSVKTIAHYELASRNVLADEPQLRAIIDSELLYGLQLREDQQILYGTGTGNDLEGIHNDADIQDYNWSSGEVGDNKADAVRRAMTLAFLADYEPTGIVVHPNDWEDMELAKDDNGQYLLAVAIAVGAEKRIWRLPIVDTPAEEDARALVGAFGLGAQLYDREEGNIRVSDSHADLFVQNGVAILAEERLALATKRPESFVNVDFDSEPV